MGEHFHKKKFFKKLTEILEFIEKNTKEGVYLHLANELQQLYDLVNEIKNERYFQHLQRSYNLPIRRAASTEDKNYKACKKCGKVVLKWNMSRHLTSLMCAHTTQEKIVSALFRNHKVNDDNKKDVIKLITYCQAKVRGDIVRRQLK